MAAALSIICNFTLHYHTSIFFNINFPPSNRISNRKSCFFKFSRICVVSSHTNPKILKPNRRSRFGQPLSTYDSDSDDDDCFEDEDDISTSDDESLDVRVSAQDRQRLKFQNATHIRRDSHHHSEGGSNAKLGHRRQTPEITQDCREKVLNVSMSSCKFCFNHLLQNHVLWHCRRQG